MAKQDNIRTGSWLIAEEFYERGDDAFVQELRQVCDADRLGAFASRWLSDPRPFARRMLFLYLDQPFSAFRHEALLKRLFKQAEKAGDDEVMARFLVGFDRSIRRQKKKRHHYDWSTRQQWTTETIVTPTGSEMPRDRKQMRFRNPETGELMAAPTAKKQANLKLFSIRTRKYLRLRAWRYFRNLGKQHPDRYVPAAVHALMQYQDTDTPDGLALLDNWGLVHLLFHHSPVIVSKASGWNMAEGRTLAELTAAPAFDDLWKNSPDSLVNLLLNTSNRPVRQWAMQLLRKDHADALTKIPLRQLIMLLSHEDEDLAQFAAESLAASSDLSRITADEWLQLLETSSPQTLDALSEMMSKHLDPAQLSLTQIVDLSCSRPFPVARLGFQWLQTSQVESSEDCRIVTRVSHAHADGLRPQIVQWLRTTLSGSRHYQNDFVLDLLDSRHADVRREGWDWLTNEPRANEDPAVWQKLMESPYDEIRLNIVQLLERHSPKDKSSQGSAALVRSSQTQPDLIRMLWATVLLNVNRGGRYKPGVVAQIVSRLRRRPEEAAELLPILGVALRSVRGPEWRSGIAGLVQIAEQHPEMESVIQKSFPELKLGVVQV